MRLIVDEMPKDTIDCPFGRVIEMYWNSQVIKRTCKLAEGGGCDLCEGKCSFLRPLFEEKADETADLYKILGGDYDNSIDTLGDIFSYFFNEQGGENEED